MNIYDHIKNMSSDFLGEPSNKKVTKLGTLTQQGVGRGGRGGFDQDPPCPNLYFEEVQTTSHSGFTPLFIGCGG